MKYEVFPSARFKKDYKRAIKQGKNIRILHSVVAQLANDEPLSEKQRDHELSGDYAGYRECHIQPDWLLVYKKENDILILTLARLGNHNELF